jgi:anti-sigma regulatory factor (Ser/Thr protein kinase)
MSDPKPRAARTDAHMRRLLAEFSVPSEPGNERLAMERVAEAIGELEVRGENLERLKTAVGEATMNAMEHGNKYRAEVPVEVMVLVEDQDLMVRITDRGSGPPPSQGGDAPDLEAKLEGMQTPRGWGMFLIARMVDEVRVSGNPDHHTVELVLRLEVGKDGN